ncbi:probable cytochrome P450 6a20 isoform X3 [Solenopsis invicta]|nr:probable cytochrome P450 6a20 isoform X3 [Solenopsis invicta]
MYAFFKPNLVITDLDLMRTVLTKEFKSFHDRGLYSNETIDPAINRLFLNGQNWLRYRAKMTPTFTAGKMKQMFVIVKQCGEELAKHLEKNAQMRDTVEMRDILTRYASDSIMSAAFGVNTNCIQKPNEYQSTSQEKTTFDSNFFKRILIRFAPQVTDFFSLPFSVQAVTNFYMNLFRDTVEYRKANGIVRPDLMSLLIEHVEKDFDPKGSRFGYLQTKVGLIYLLSKYKFKLHSRTPVPLAFSERSAILAPKSGVYLTIELR